LRSYSVLAADMLRDFESLTFDLLILDNVVIHVGSRGQTVHEI